MRILPALLTTLASAALAWSLACGAGAAAGTGPSIEGFVAVPAIVTAGDPVGLRGTFSNGTGVITPGGYPAASGAVVQVHPSDSTVYTLTVTSPAGAAINRTVQVDLVAAPTIASFAALPADLLAGTPATLQAVFAGGTGRIDQGVGLVTSGQAMVTGALAGPTTFTLTVTNPVGAAVTRQLTVTPRSALPAISAFNADTPQTGAGRGVTLSWTVAGATALSIDQGVGAVTGTSVTVSPAATTTYTLTASNPAGSATAQAQVTVIPPPAISAFSPGAPRVGAGQGVLLSWTATGATALSIDQGVGPVTGTSVTVSPAATTTYTLTASNPAGTATSQCQVTVVPVIAAGSLDRASWIALNPRGTIDEVSISGRPSVTFTLTDAFGNGITGLEAFTRRNPATDLLPGLPNFSFEIAKLVPPATPAAPSRWVSYLVTSAPTLAQPSRPAGPRADLNGTLVGHGDGSYTYTFWTDITRVAANLAAAGTDVSALGDVSYQPALTHRLVLEFYGNARGTGSGAQANTADGSAGEAAAAIAAPVNLIRDFIPATGRTVTAADPSREIVLLQSCNGCHTRLSHHDGHRVDPRTCVTCHTDQRRLGASEAVKVLDGSGNWSFAGSSAQVNGTSGFDFPQLMHRVHRGEGLQVAGYDLWLPSRTAAGAPVNVNQVRFPQHVGNCVSCHAGAPQSGNWKTSPSRAACGGCHDTTQFLLGINHLPGSTEAVADDSSCSQCHHPADIALAHLPVVRPDRHNAGLTLAQGGLPENLGTHSAAIASPGNLPAGAINVTWDLAAFAVDPVTRHPAFRFRFLQDGAPVPFNAHVDGSTELWPGFAGSPDFIVAFGAAQDGIAAPADYNVSRSARVKEVWAGLPGTTFSGPDGNGYYTATLDSLLVPPGAALVAGGIGYHCGVVAQSDILGGTAATGSLPLTQTNLPQYPFNAITLPGSTTPVAAPFQGGLGVATPNVWARAAGTASRRAIVDQARCDACHQDLGLFTDGHFHAGQRNDVGSCGFCHNPSAPAGSGWSGNLKDAVHGLHAAGLRTTPLTWASQQRYWNLGYPAPLNNCEACHVPGSYDFSSSASAAAIPGLLWSTVATGTTPAGGLVLADPGAYNPSSSYLSPLVSANTAYGATYAVNTTNSAIAGTWNGQAVTLQPGQANEAAPGTLVTSPVSAACSACHDDSASLLHMQWSGGRIGVARGTVVSPVVTAGALSVAPIRNPENCLICHGSGRVADIRNVHMTF